MPCTVRAGMPVKHFMFHSSLQDFLLFLFELEWIIHDWLLNREISLILNMREFLIHAYQIALIIIPGTDYFNKFRWSLSKQLSTMSTRHLHWTTWARWVFIILWCSSNGVWWEGQVSHCHIMVTVTSCDQCPLPDTWHMVTVMRYLME